MHLVAPCHPVVDLAMPRYTAAVNPVKPVDAPAQGRPLRWVGDLVRPRLALARHWGAPAAGRHDRDQQRTPHPLEEHPSHGFARREGLLRLGLEACVDPGEPTAVVENSRTSSPVIQALEVDRCHRGTAPAWCGVVREGMQGTVADVVSFYTCSMSVQWGDLHNKSAHRHFW